MDKKEKVVNAVEEQVVNTTAIAISPKMKALSQKVVKEEMELAHNQQFATLAINDAIAQDKAAYGKQLDKIAKSATEAKTKLAKEKELLSKDVKSLKSKSLRTKIMPSIRKAYKSISAIKTISKSFNMPKTSDVSVSYIEPDKDGKSKLEKRGYISWGVTIKQGTSYSGVNLDGHIELDAACKKRINEISKIRDKIKKLKNADKDIRILIQDLDREKASLQLQLDSEALRKSITGNEMMARVKSMRKSKVKALPTGII